MADIEGYVTVYETSDGGTGNAVKTFWQFFVDAQPVRTENHWIAETMRLAIETSSKVKVVYEPTFSNTISQARLEFKYLCESVKITPCDSSWETKTLCETRRLAPCEETPGGV